jgi:hypothetical protein
MRPRLERNERAEGALRWAKECQRRTEEAGGPALLSYRINEQALCTWAISPVDIPVDNAVEKIGYNERCVNRGRCFVPNRRACTFVREVFALPLRTHCFT